MKCAKIESNLEGPGSGVERSEGLHLTPIGGRVLGTEQEALPWCTGGQFQAGIRAQGQGAICFFKMNWLPSANKKAETSCIISLSRRTQLGRSLIDLALDIDSL